MAEEGQPILQAIYRYKEATGIYPESLSVLAPNYLKESPLEDWRQGWHYSLGYTWGNTNSFILSRFSIGYKTRVEYIDDGIESGWRLNAEGDKRKLNLQTMKPTNTKPEKAVPHRQ
jgi:hypothetical protein